MHIEFPCRTDAGIDEASGDDWARGKRTVHALGDLEEPVGRLAVEELAEERHDAGPRSVTREEPYHQEPRRAASAMDPPVLVQCTWG